MSDAKKVGSELVGAARDSAVSLLDAQRARAADQITALGDALRRSAESFESTGAGGLVEYANQAADQISGFADTVRDRSWNELAGDLESFGRRYPMTFMASAMSIGFVLGRFLLSSSERTHQAGMRGASYSGGRVSGMQREAGGASRTAQSGARAEYGSSIRE
jgi:flagellar biosynthesis regulator FlaF